jgi:hypothetical protein
MNEEAAFFMDPQCCPSVLLFNEQERDAVCKHHEARGAAILTLTVLDAEPDQRHRELRARIAGSGHSALTGGKNGTPLRDAEGAQSS